MADNLTKQLIETVKNKVPLTGGLSIKGYPVMGTLSDMKNFKIEEGVLKLRYGTKTVASFDNKRFYFLKNFEFCGAEVLFGLDYQLCLHAFFENYEGYDFIVRDASQWHKNEMQLPQNQLVVGKDENDRDIISDPWTLGKLFDNGTQFWAYENQKYIMFFNDCGEIRVIVKDGGFKIHKDEQYIEVDIKDATNRVFDIPPVLREDKRGVAPSITGEYRFARVNELGVISELTEPKYLQNWQRVIACYGDVSMPEDIRKTESYDEISNPAGTTYGLIICGRNLHKSVIRYTADSFGDTSGYQRQPYSMIQYKLPGSDINNKITYDDPSCFLFSMIHSQDLADSKFWLDIKSGDINDIYDTSITTERRVFQKKADSTLNDGHENFEFYEYKNPARKYSQVFFNEEQGCFPYQWFEGSKKVFANAYNIKIGDAVSYAIHARNVAVSDYKATPYTPKEDKDDLSLFYLTELETEETLVKKSLGNLFVLTWWKNETQYVLMGEGAIYVADEIPYKISGGQKKVQEYSFAYNIPAQGKNLYHIEPMDTIRRVFGGIPYKTTLTNIERNTSGYFYSYLSKNGRFAIWNNNKILGISQRLFTDGTASVLYNQPSVDPNQLLVRYSPVLSLEYMNQRSFRFELPLIRRAIRKPQFLCVSNNYVYEFEDNRLWYGSAYDFMLTGYAYLDGSLLKLIAYNEGILACTTSGLYYVNRENVQPVVNGRAIRADFAGETQVGGIVIAENKVYVVRTEITDSGARIETANLISEPINELVFNGAIKLACNKRQIYIADDYNVYGFDTRAGIWNLRYNYGNKRIADIFILDNRLGILFDNEVDAAKANTEYSEPILPS